VLDARIDAEMSRTRMRRCSRRRVGSVRVVICLRAGRGLVLILALLVNALTAVLTFSRSSATRSSTVWLKRDPAEHRDRRRGGCAPRARLDGRHRRRQPGCAPALPHHLRLDAAAFLGARNRAPRYARVGIPMLPVTHGVAYTKQFIWYYTVLLSVITVLPFVTGMAGPFYLAAAIVLDGLFLRHAWMLRQSDRADLPMRVFRFSINYLALLFAAFLVDHYLPRTF
jgi:protoheme IX farnesyltransferase